MQQVLKVEFRTQLADEDYSSKIISDTNFNNFKNNKFLTNLLKDCIFDLEGESFMQQQNDEVDDDDEGVFSFQSMIEEQEEIQDITLIDASKQRNKINKLQEINQIVEKLEKALSKISKVDIQIYDLKEAPLDAKLDSPLTVTLRMQKKYLCNFLKFHFSIIPNSQPVFMNFKNAQIIDDRMQNQEYSIKIGKIPFTLNELTFSYVTGEHLKDKLPDQPINSPINLFLSPYFKFSDLQSQLFKVKAYMMFHCEESKLARKVEFILNILDKFLLKIEVDLVNCQYCHAVTDSFGKKIHFKLLCPPNYSISLSTKRKFELFNMKSDWIRVHNIFSNAYYNKYKNEIERLIIINNTLITAQFTFQQGSKEEMAYKMVIEKLSQYNLMYSDAIDLNLFELEQRKTQWDQLYALIEQSQLSFEQKYNILCVVSQNRITDLDLLKQLILHITQFQRDNHEKILESTFQLFSRYSTDLNFSVRQSELNKKNYLTFKRDLKRCLEDVIIPIDQNEQKRVAMIKRVSLTPSGYIFNLKLPEETSEIIRQYYNQLDNFIRLHFEDENLETIHGHHYITEYYFKSKLSNGLHLLGEQFRLLTWSASQLRGGSCWIFNYNRAQISRQNFIDSIGNFNTLNMDQVAKNAARLGQNFSSSKSIDLRQIIVKTQVPDKVGDNGKLYTDGIGKISRNLIEMIRVEMNNHTISAIQVRYHGAKGVLLLNDDLPDNTIELRKSMIKFNPTLMNDGNYKTMISLLDYNKFRGGYLNRQIIILLVTLGIQEEVFMQLQREYLHKIANLSAVDSSIYNHFLVDYNGELQGLPSIIDNIRMMINANLNENNNHYIKRVLDRLKRRGLMQLRTKSNILMDQAARVLGVVDDYDILDQGEVVCIVKQSLDVNHKYITGEIIVVRNPCLHPGDIRKVRALSENEILSRYNMKNPFAEYYNCIVFPCKGNSIPADCGGGDLDGDIYFVSWDPKVIPKTTEYPMNYDEEKKPAVVVSKQIQAQGYISAEDFFQENKMIEFLLEYLNFDVLGKIDNSHLAIADGSPDYAKDPKCIRLAELHSAAVDYVKHGNKVEIPNNLVTKRWPDFMEKDSMVYESTSILGKLYREVLQCINQEPQSVLDGYQQEGLPEIDTRFIYKFQQEDELAQVGDQAKQYQDYYQNEYQQYLTDNICRNALKCLNHIFDNFDSLRKMFDLTNEYEIYTGYFTNFTQGEGTRLKKKINVEHVQKRVILSLVQLKQEIYKTLSANEEERLAEISIIHFLMMYSPKSHQDQIAKYTSLKFYHQELEKTINKNEEIYKLFSRLKNKFPQWYRGCSWFFFTLEILSFAQKTNDDSDELI
ncbi:unnamed protein product (macronuclear) [Paramecium tetraurelia]|uniref:RNA-dependent RNA polymerase n=1 Tax=Paramecium tetraurelia TaxID=5888 RepID=Q3SE67_PARTE|nr:uncharacterized protein GSPATT00024768001 [Paramecium tetraurelia]CAI39057.1 RNA-dependent RNA polymerase [Paramecium tetraurelia]CAK92037.1 unnamed protein product [Paramecium tetraurelia]|eukprot:XP_001459434.1 hypothetical protein (macronuclear) [Paramecium tetraurelia strain d4-2]